METTAPHINKQVEDSSTGEIILLNTCTRDAITTFPSMRKMYDNGYSKYIPESGALNEIELLLKGKTITIVLGTWCGDSREQLPHFLKTTDASSLDKKDITFICVDRTKKAENGSLENLNIDRVPTFIIYDDEKELGRIIEKPIISIEEDLALILSKN
ncbi:thiol reductase thioredoxin [Pedobacter ginsengisoli]|uniref:Thiol reductase thioredoxin n=1 Tax=Pedobacter ginsengisoli TaxID=363852 RepID=A0A2D1U1J3_9SPHI|nr:thioredoxin family protein [Pedobacter ginsengisoli]ATP55459.1 thiol reductase thioredoxin [Pedobacter ginsengisoli]